MKGNIFIKLINIDTDINRWIYFTLYIAGRAVS